MLLVIVDFFKAANFQIQLFLKPLQFFFILNNDSQVTCFLFDPSDFLLLVVSIFKNFDFAHFASMNFDPFIESWN